MCLLPEMLSVSAHPQHVSKSLHVGIQQEPRRFDLLPPSVGQATSAGFRDPVVLQELPGGHCLGSCELLLTQGMLSSVCASPSLSRTDTARELRLRGALRVHIPVLITYRHTAGNMQL